jgi:hypothetical protein
MRPLFGVLVLLGGLAHLSKVAAQEVPVTREGAYWVRTRGGTIHGPLPPRLQVAARARIVLRGSAGSELSYTLRQRVRASSPEEARALMGAAVLSRVSADTARLSVASSPRVTAELEVLAPPSVRVASLEAPFGDLEAYDFNGSVQAITQGGSIRMDRVRGDAVVRTAGGEIRLGRISGAVQCLSGGGAVSLELASGDADCTSGGGDMFIEETRGRLSLSTAGNIHVRRAGGNVEAHTSGGVIEIGEAGGMVVANTEGGSIQVGSAQGVQAASLRGMVRLRSGQGPVSVAAAAGSILAELLAGARLQDSSFVSQSGDITLLIPSNLAVSVMAASEGGTNTRIVSDFPEVRVRNAGLLRPPVIAEGSINGGGPVLRVNAASGIIYLRRVK